MEWETSFASGAMAIHQKQPFLEILVQPQPKFRFRYRSEMTGKHGSLLGVPSATGLLRSTRTSSSQASSASTGMYLSSLTGATCSTPNYGMMTGDIGSSGVSAHVHHVEGSSNYPTSAMQGQPSNGSKLYPTVKLHNFPNDAIIRCSLVCDTPPYYPHPHLLEMGHGSGVDEEVISRENCFVEIPLTAQNDHTAAFQGLNIIYVSKKGLRKQLCAKMSQLSHGDGRRIGEERIDDLSLGINLNVVALYFEAFRRDPLDPNNLRLLCPAVVSNPIQHNKSTQTGELRIVRIDKHASCCTGDEEVFILVEKVDKHNIQVKFYQENDQGHEIWKAYGKFSKLDVHHQYAIVFRTPPYRSFDIDTEVPVKVCIERPSDSATSASLPFIYKPIERRSSSVRQGSNTTFPCDINLLPIAGDPQSKVLAANVALSVCQGLHTWAETSDLNCILQKLRHLLCIVNENGDNALHTAVHNQQREPFKKILETVDSSPDISYLLNEPNLNNLTPLALAVTTNSIDFVQELINHNADLSIPNSEGDNPLHIATKGNNIECVNCILKSSNASSIINRYNYSSMTALHIAALHGYVEILDTLCDHKATLTNQEGMYGRTPLHLAVEKEEVQNLISTMTLLKMAGKESEIANIQNYRGDTPLHCCASLGYKSLCALLLHFGADPTIENYIKTGTEENEDEEESENGQTVFDVAANDEIRNILTASPEEWSKVYQSCSLFITELKSSERDPHEAKVLTADSIFLDSGINITDLNI